MQWPGMGSAGDTRPLNGLNFAWVSAYNTFRPFACAGRRSRLVHGSFTGVKGGLSNTVGACVGVGMAAIARPLIMTVPRLRNGLGSVLIVGSAYQFQT